MDKPLLIPINHNVDERGIVYGITQFIDEAFKGKVEDTRSLYRRIYTVQNFQPGQIRAWHGHKTSSTILHIIKGASKILATPIQQETISAYQEVRTFTLSDKKPGLVYVPPAYYNGHISLEPSTILLVFSSATIEEVAQDDVRMGWDELGVRRWEISRK